MADKFDQLEQQLEGAIDNLRQIGIIAGDFQPHSQPLLTKKIQATISTLQNIDSNRQLLADVKIPLDVFQYVDDAKNPQLYTKDCMERALVRNEEINGKIHCFQKFKLQLLSELGKLFPQEIAKYRALRSDDI